MLRIGIDLGGTKIEGVVLDGEVERLRRRVPTPKGGYDAVIAAVRDLVLQLEREAGGTATVGIGTPGSASPVTGLLRNSNSLVLNGRPFARDIGAALGREVRIANDADCFALSEAADGAGAGQRVVFGAILGTGVGGGIVVDGRLWTGGNGIAGEWGHNLLAPRDGAAAPRCWCGRLGCVETWLSGPALAADHRRHGGSDDASASIDAHAITRLADTGDAAAMATLDRFCERLAEALAAVVNLLDPSVIVLGGGLSHIDAIYDRVPALMAAHVFADRAATPLLRNAHGDSSGVRGAARLWPEQ